MSKDIMIDLETLGTSPGSVVLSIGAVAFDPAWDGVANSFYRNVDRETSLAMGLTKDASTEAWWEKQSVEAKAALLEPTPIGTTRALLELDDFVMRNDCANVWCHGATFDVPLLEAIYRKLGRRPVWKYYAVRDTRTIFALCGSTNDAKFVDQFRDAGVAHHALNDAIAQAKAVQSCMRRIQEWKTAHDNAVYRQMKAGLAAPMVKTGEITGKNTA